MADQSHFLFNSDYPTDKILWAKKDTITLHSTSNNRTTLVEIDTGIKAQLFAEGDFRLTTSDDVTPILSVAGSLLGPDSLFVDVATYILNGTCWVGIRWYDFTANCDYNNKQVEYRVWAFGSEDGTKNVDTGPTINVSNNILTLSSDADYPRIVGEGYFTKGQTITHNLGYIPLIKFWRLYPNQTAPSGETTDIYMPVARGWLGDTSSASFDDEMQATSNTLTTAPLSGDTPTYYYRMYAL